MTLCGVFVFLVVTFGCNLRLICGLDCAHRSVLNGTPCLQQGNKISREDCKRLAPKCCVFSVGATHCFVNKDYKEIKESRQCLQKTPSFLVSSENAELSATGYLLSTHIVVSELQCLDHCMRNHHCSTFNYQYRTGISGTRVCELLSRITKIITRLNFKYKQVRDHEWQALLSNGNCK